MAVPKSLIRKEKKSKEDEQTSAELSSAHCRLEAKCRQVQTLNELNFSCLPYNKHLINRAESVCMGQS